MIGERAGVGGSVEGLAVTAWALCTDRALACGPEPGVSLFGRHLEEFEGRLGNHKWMWSVALGLGSLMLPCSWVLHPQAIS